MDNHSPSTTPLSSTKSLTGPSRPPKPETVAELYNRREAEREAQDTLRESEYRQKRKERKEIKDEEKDQRATGRDRLQEKRQEVRMAHANFANRKDDDMAPEFDDNTLMGGGDSFAAMKAARDRAKSRPSKRDLEREEREAEQREKRMAYRAKENATMDIFKVGTFHSDEFPSQLKRIDRPWRQQSMAQGLDLFMNAHV